jgi:predicted RNA binding protein YcfA (HicA-like mRNA interferase family)
MTRLPRLKGREVVRALEKAEFVLERTRGSHAFLKHPDGRATTVPIHSGETIGPGLLRAILRDVELTVDDLTILLHSKAH